MKVQISSALMSVTGAKVVIGSLPKSATRFAHFDGSTVRNLKVFASPVTASADPGYVSGSRGSPGEVVTDRTTATPVGGTAPYSYAWTRTGGDTGTPTNPTMAITAFTANLGYGSDEYSEFTCTVTDATGAMATATVSAFFAVADLGGGGIQP